MWWRVEEGVLGWNKREIELLDTWQVPDPRPSSDSALMRLDPDISLLADGQSPDLSQFKCKALATLGQTVKKNVQTHVISFK